MRFSGQKATSLSMADRLTLAESVLMAILAYAMQTVVLPSSLCYQINWLVRDFIWGSSSGARKTSLVSWHDMCQPITHGGGSIMNLKSRNKAFLMKVCFNIIAQSHLLWVKFLQHKYKWDLLDSVTKYSSPYSHLWRKLSGLWRMSTQGWLDTSGIT